MSGLWSGEPASIKLSDLNIICVVLGCGVEELLIPEPGKVQRPAKEGADQAAATSSVDRAAKIGEVIDASTGTGEVLTPMLPKCSVCPEQ